MSVIDFACRAHCVTERRDSLCITSRSLQHEPLRPQTVNVGTARKETHEPDRTFWMPSLDLLNVH